MTFQTLTIKTFGLGRVTRHHEKGWDVFKHHGGGRGKTITSHAAKLMNPGEATEGDKILHRDVTRQSRIICEYVIIANEAIVGNVHVCHDPIIITEARYSSAPFRAPVDGAVFPNHVTVTHFQYGMIAFIEFFVLRNFPHRSELVNFVITPDIGGPLNDSVRPYPATVTDGDVRANN